MYTVNSHLKIMQSFVSSPESHRAALQRPEMIGGPFINYPAARVPEVRELMRGSTARRARLIELAAAIASLEKLLAGAQLTGYSLEPLYPRIPEPLRGFVELVYDLNNQPSVRYLEGLLYRSRYYDPSLQSVDLFAIDDDDRPFVFSTPRLGGPDRIHVALPFADVAWDEVHRMRRAPAPVGRLRELLGLAPGEEERLGSLVTTTPPRFAAPFHEAGVRVSYFGHACVLVESARASVLVDPLVAYEHGAGAPRLAHADLPEKIDVALVTHNHADHLLLETLLPLRHKIRTLAVPKNTSGALADPSLKLALRAIGFRDVVELEEMEVLPLPGGGITAVPFLGEHCDLNIRTKSAYHVALEGRSVLFAADSSNLAPEMYDHVRESLGPVDVLFIGLECDGAPLSWLYGPLACKPLARRDDQSRRTNASDCDKGLAIVDRLAPKQAYVYAMGQEPWLTYVTSIRYTADSLPMRESERFVAECRRRGLVSERLYGPKRITLAPATAARATA
jgi:L-ascorbate metabolism protein UlaG (beta-lactamase superfamily)